MSSFLNRPNFHLGPISVDMIEPHLYLGSLAAAKDINTLTKLNITHILTIDTCPLPDTMLAINRITFKFIELSDQPKEDILSHFEESNDFISEGISKGNVLVHCYFGVSRSATLVLAYVMKKYKLSYLEAFERVKAKRPIVYPNHGFVSQLHLYKEMNYTIDPNDKKYKMFKLVATVDKFKNLKVLPHNFPDLIKPDPGLTHNPPEPVYRCKKCRRTVATDSNVLFHQDKGKPCTQIFFVEPMIWMQVSHSLQGKLFCPKCQSKLGAFNWVTGCECPCKVKVAPAFYLTPSKVDYCPARS